MPEMPEVETVRRTLTPLVAGKTIKKVEVWYDKIIAGIDDVTVDDQQNVPARAKGVYNLSGVKVCETSEFNSLPSGVYIVDGKQKIK